MKSVNTPSTGWKIKTRSLSNGNNQPSPLMESDQAFDRRLDHWAQSSTFRNMSSHIINDVQKDMDRRQPKQHAPLEKRKSQLSDIQSFMFDTPSSLNDKDHTMWLYHGRDIHHPHQWLKLASLFHIHPKTAHQRSLLYPATLQAAQIDRHVSTDINRKPLESYLELRRTQNRTYAEHAVAEGFKLYETQKVTEALEYYKRALDMDPQYAEGWYRVAQSLLQQKRSDEALGTLKRALRIDPTHEDAKALLCTLENTTSYTSDTKESKRKRSPSPSSRKAKRRRSPSPIERKRRASSRHDSPTDRKRHTSPTDRKRHTSPTDRKRHASPKRHSHRSTSTDRKRHRSPSKRHSHRSRHHSGDRHRRHHRHRSTSKDRSHRKKSSSDSRRHHRSKHSPSRKHD